MLGGNGTTDIYSTCNSVKYEHLKEQSKETKTHKGQKTVEKEEVTTKKMFLPYTLCHQRMQIFPC